MYTTSLVLTLVSAAQAHMSLFYPPPLGGDGSINKQSTIIDPEFNFPLGCCGPDGGPSRPSPGICRGHLDRFDVEEASVTWQAGQDAHFQLTNHNYDPKAAGGTHSGGSCQVGFSTDKGATWKVAASYHGACPYHTVDGSPEAQTFDFKVPTGMPDGDALFAWVWLNREHESYMNCAKVKIGGGAGLTLPTPANPSSPMVAQPLPPTGTQTLSPSTGAQPLLPPTGAQPLSPPTGAQPSLPPTGAQPSLPPTGAQPSLPPTGAQPLLSPINGQPISLPINGQPISPSTAAQPMAPPTAAQPIAPQVPAPILARDSVKSEKTSASDSTSDSTPLSTSPAHREVKPGVRRYTIDGQSCECHESRHQRCFCSASGSSGSERAATEKKALRMHRRILSKRVDACDWASAPAMEVSYFTSDANCAPNAKTLTPESDTFEIGWDVSCGVVQGDGQYNIKMMDCHMYGA